MPVKEGGKLIEIDSDVLQQLQKEQIDLSSDSYGPLYASTLTKFVNEMLRSLYE